MSRNPRIALSCIGFLVCSILLGGCSTMYGKSMMKAQKIHKYSYPRTQTLRNDKFEISLTMVYSGNQRMNYYVFMRVKNISEEKAVFNSEELELLEPNSGLSFYSVSKDKETVETSGMYSDLITNMTLKPGRMTEGFVIFITRKGRATADNLELYLGKNSIKLTNVGLMPYAEWKEFFSGKK